MNALVLAVCAACAALAFVALELGARAWLRAWRRSFAWTPGARRRLETDRDAVPELEPVVEHRFNRDGERGDEPPDDPRGAYRVLVVGGSAAECWFVDQQSAWPSVLERELSRPERLCVLRAERVHVGSAARSLVTCRHLDAMLERHLEGRERLDAIVLMTGASDVLTWLEQDAPRRIADEPVSPRRIFGWYPDGPFGWTPSKLALRRLAAFARSRWAHALERRTNVGRRLVEQRRMRAEALEIVRTCPDPRPMLAHFDLWFERLVRRAQRHARLVVVARQPWLERDFSPEEARRLWSFPAAPLKGQRVTRYYAHDVAWQLLDRVDRRAASIARELGATELDVNAHVAPTFDNYYDDMHHTPRGCALIGEAVARAIVLAVQDRRELVRGAVDAPSMVERATADVELRKAG